MSIEKDIKEYGCTLMSFSTKNDPITIIGVCGHEVTYSNYFNFVKSFKMCRQCSSSKRRESTSIPYSEVLELAKTKGVTLVKYTKAHDRVYYTCKCGNIGSVANLSMFRKSQCVCNKCRDTNNSLRQRKPIEDVSALLSDKGCNMSNYNTKTGEVTFTASCGHEHKVNSLSNFKKSKGLCSVCCNLSSLPEQEVISILPPNIDVVRRYKYSSRKEVDIYLPNNKFGIEYNGLYWHSDSKGKGRNYHLNKTNELEGQGISLFHIFENEWKLKKDIISSIILNRLGKSERIFARKTEIREITTKQCSDFLEENHRQGAVFGGIRIGLFLGDVLVSVMLFGKARYGKEQYELLRFCNKLNTTVIGGASKLLSFFEVKYKPESIVSYADRRFSTGGLYEKLGFTFSHNSSPNYWYFKEGTLLLESRVKYQKHKLKNLLPNFDITKTEYENMLQNKFLRIWDCGNSVYKKYYNNK